MTRAVQLNNVEHATLRVRTERRADLGDALMSCPIFPHEFRRAQAHYPIVFAREGATGRYRPHALFGLEQGENLFLAQDGAPGWDAAYVPLAIRMQPFLIGRDQEGGLEVHVNLDSPRVVATEGGDGEPVFLPEGGQAPLLQEAAQTLAEIAEGDRQSTAYCALLDELKLIEPFTLDVTLDDGTQGQLSGYAVVAEERLSSLGGADLERLQHAHALLPTFLAVASVSRLEDLVARRNARLPAA